MLPDFQTSLYEQSQTPSPQAQRQLLAERGDFRGLFKLIQDTPPTTFDLRVAFGQLQTALDVAGRSGGAAFSDELFQTIVSFSAQILCRVQYLTASALEQSDHSSSRELRMPGDFYTTLWPQVQQMYEHMAGLLQAWASSSRQWQLVQKRTGGLPTPNPAVNGTAKKPSPAKRRPHSSPPNRLGDLLDDSPN